MYNLVKVRQLKPYIVLMCGFNLLIVKLGLDTKRVFARRVSKPSILRHSRVNPKKFSSPIITTSKLVVCTAPRRGYYRLNPYKGHRKFGTALQFQAAAHVRLSFLCLTILATRKRVCVFFYAYLVRCIIFLKLIPYVL